MWPIFPGLVGLSVRRDLNNGDNLMILLQVSYMATCKHCMCMCSRESFGVENACVFDADLKYPFQVAGYVQLGGGELNSCFPNKISWGSSS